MEAAQQDCVWDSRLRLRISECKNLPKMDLVGQSDPYCRVVIDDEVLARTSTKWNTDAPFFGEEYTLALSTNFRLMSIEVYDQDVLTKDDPIGRVDFTREDLFAVAKDAGDRWYPLVKMTPVMSVVGEIFLGIEVSDGPAGHHVEVTVVRARDILPKDNPTRCDPYCDVQLGSKSFGTRVIKNCRCPTWDSTFVFDVDRLPPSLTVTVLDEQKNKSGGNFLGEAEIDLTKVEKDLRILKWFRLRPRKQDYEDQVVGNGTIRLSLYLTHELYMPLSYYELVCEFIDSSVQEEDEMQNGFLAVLESLLRENPKDLDREQLARALIMVLYKRGSALTCARHLIASEIAVTTDTATIFRGNSLASKCIDHLMKIVGLPYLHKTIKPTIDCIFQEKKDCEIDPDKLGKKPSDGAIKKRIAELARYLTMLLRDIFASVDRCPSVMRAVFGEAQRIAMESPLASKDRDIGYTAVSGFIFLRFFAPAVLSPHLFGMRDDLADAKTARTLTLLAKSLQAVGNLGANFQQGKETFMEGLKPAILQHISDMKVFIDKLCTVDPGFRERRQTRMSVEEDLEAELLTAKLQVLEVGAKAFARLSVTLTNSQLSWAKNSKSVSLNHVELAQILSVEQVEAAAFDKKHVLQIVLRTFTIYLAFPNVTEMEVWLITLRSRLRVVASNLRNTCHSGILKQNIWTCCLKDSKASPCSKAHSSCVIDTDGNAMTEAEAAHNLFSMLGANDQLIRKKFGVTHAAFADDERSLTNTAATLLSRLLTVTLEHLLLSKPVPEVDPADLQAK